MPDLFALMVFASAVALTEGLYFLWQDLPRGGQAWLVNRRLGRRVAERPAEMVLHRLSRRPPAALRSLDEALSRLALYRRFDRLCQLAGWRHSTVVAWLATVLGLMLPLPLLAAAARRRARRLQDQLVDAIDIMVQALRSGHPVMAAISLVAGELPDPIGSEFSLTADEMTYGLDLRDALANLAARVPVADLHYLVVATRVQYGTGGNLAEVLASLAELLRARALTLGKAQALSAEARLSAWVLSLLPVAVALLVHLLNPDYYREVAGDPLFPRCMAAGGASLLLGILTMCRMVRLDV